MSILELVADRQAMWSATANTLKSRIDLARNASFFLSITGALVASLASMQAAVGPVRTILISVGAGLLAITGIISSRVLTSETIRQQIRARAAAEALKREAFLYAAAAGDYADRAASNDKLNAAMERIEAEVTDLTLFQTAASGRGSSPRSELTFAEYLRDRIDPQLTFYDDRSRRYSKRSKLLHITEFCLAFLAAILTALAGVLGKGSFDIAAIVGVVTTCAASVMAHLQASRYDDLIVAYRATARKLATLKATADEGTATLGDFANTAEEILTAETNSWQAIWSSKPKP